eukprot:jgi/Tetstr1/459221/TSEL_000031.t1
MSLQVSLQQLAAIQEKQDRVRNVCILAHVDHGKTTLSDHLISANGLIHPRLAGELRYLDAREDEQARGITMKSSAISLMHIPGRGRIVGAQRSVVTPEELAGAYLVNLIDSPGHVDFCSEVSTAARLSDGALVVVDCVEGVCIQTHAVLRQAFQERIHPVLVLNKIDRLILEQQLTPSEAYEHLTRIVSDVNRVVSGFESEHHMSEVDAILSLAQESAKKELGDEEAATAAEGITFAPEKGNVAFASAFDGWAFRIDQFAALIAGKLGAKPEALRRALWGEYYFQAKEKKVTRKKPVAGKGQPMFVQFVLEPLWRAYGVLGSGREEAQATLAQMVKSLGLTSVTDKDLRHSDVKYALKAVLRAWLPLSEAILGMVTEQLPSPPAAAPERLARLLPAQPDLSELPPADAGRVRAMVRRVSASVGCCGSGDDAPVVVYVSKMISVPATTLPRNPGDPLPDTKEVFLAFGRVFSGRVREGQRLHVLSSAYTPARPGDVQRRTGTVRAVYLMMGTGLERLASVPAGNVLALAGFEDSILKTATLASTPCCPPMAAMTFQAAPIVRVAVEPVRATEIQALRRGLLLLNRADPMVEVTVLDTGEHVLSAAGEVHLETCIKDLRERFANVDIQVSPPLVAFRESVADTSEDSAAAQRPIRAVEATTPSGTCALRIRALPLPRAMAAALEEVGEALPRVLGGSGSGSNSGGAERAAVRERLEQAMADDDGARGAPMLQAAWSLGPRDCGPNVLCSPAALAPSLWALPDSAVCKLSAARQARQAAAAAAAEAAESGDAAEEAEHGPVPLGGPLVATRLGLRPQDKPAEEGGEQAAPAAQRAAHAVQAGVAAGFQLATAAGPLRVEVSMGEVLAVAKEAFRRALVEARPRLVEAMYLCEVAASSEALSGVYAVLGRRRARIQSEEIREGSNTFIIRAFVPVEASFGFAAEIRRKSSGAAAPSLMLSHWERLPIDPYFVPVTEEEREEFGEQGQGFAEPNLARKFIDTVRRRKGIIVEEKIVESATKQRTLARKV